MRPNTLAEATTRIEQGEPLEKALSEFLDTFYTAPDTASRIEMLREEPASIGARQDALIRSIAAGAHRVPDRSELQMGLEHRLGAERFDTGGVRRDA